MGACLAQQCRMQQRARDHLKAAQPCCAVLLLVARHQQASQALSKKGPYVQCNRIEYEMIHCIIIYYHVMQCNAMSSNTMNMVILLKAAGLKVSPLTGPGLSLPWTKMAESRSEFTSAMQGAIERMDSLQVTGGLF